MSRLRRHNFREAISDLLTVTMHLQDALSRFHRPGLHKIDLRVHVASASTRTLARFTKPRAAELSVHRTIVPVEQLHILLLWFLFAIHSQAPPTSAVNSDSPELKQTTLCFLEDACTGTPRVFNRTLEPNCDSRVAVAIFDVSSPISMIFRTQCPRRTHTHPRVTKNQSAVNPQGKYPHPGGHRVGVEDVGRRRQTDPDRGRSHRRSQTYFHWASCARCVCHALVTPARNRRPRHRYEISQFVLNLIQRVGLPVFFQCHTRLLHCSGGFSDQVSPEDRTGSAPPSLRQKNMCTLDASTTNMERSTFTLNC